MVECVEQIFYIKFYEKFGNTQAETIRKIQQVFGDDAVGITQITNWYNWFKNCCKSVESDQHSGATLTSWNTQNVEKEILDNKRSSF